MKVRFDFENALRVQGFIILVVGALCIVGWASSTPILSNFHKSSIPMAPDTAFVFIALGLILVTKSFKSNNTHLKAFSVVSISLITFYGLLKALEYFLNLDLTFANKISSFFENRATVHLQKMSPITGFLFFLTGFVFLVKHWYGEQKVANSIIALLGFAITFVGFTVVLGYMFQTPLLYQSNIIPMALPTAICFVVIGFAVLLLSGNENMVTRQFVGVTAYNVLVRSIIPILFLVILIQGLMLKYFSDSTIFNFALFSALLSLFFIILASMLIMHVSKSVFKNAFQEEVKRKQAEMVVKSKDQLLKLTAESARVGSWEYDIKTMKATISQDIAGALGLNPDQKFDYDEFEKSLTKESKKAFDDAIALTQSKGITSDFEVEIQTPSGFQKFFRIIGVPETDSIGVYKIKGIIHDITHEKDYNNKQQLLSRILSLLNHPIEWSQLIEQILSEIKSSFQIDAIALRVHEVNDYHYNHAIGFSEKFIAMESSLLPKENLNCTTCSEESASKLECFCGVVLNDQSDSTKPYFTKYGSFWVNSTSLIKSIIPSPELPYHYRNYCQMSNYESVALIPLRTKNGIIGLLQLNDKRTNRFNPQSISYLEELSSIIGIAFKRIQSENQIKESEKRFRVIFESAAVGVALLDRIDLKPIKTNQKYCDIFGYPMGEIAGISLMDIAHPDDVDESQYHQDRIIQGEISEYTFFKRFYRKSGEVVWVKLFVSSITETEPHQSYLIAIIEDVTALKQVEWAMQERMKEIQCLQSITQISDKDSLTLGKFVNKVINLIPLGFQYPEDTKCRIVLNNQTYQSASFIESQYLLREEIGLRNKSAGFIEIHLNKQVNDRSVVLFQKEERGLLSTIAKVLSEFIERKRREQIQRIIYNSTIAVDSTESLADLIEYIKNQISTLIDTTNFFAAFYDEDTNTITLPYHKDQKDNISQFPAGKTLTMHVIKTQKPLLANKKRIKELEKSGIVERLGSNAAVWLGVPLIVKGKVTGIFAVQSYEDEHAYNNEDMEMLEFIARQVSISLERKKAEQELRAAYEKAMESDRLKSTFLATMSHELRTPLNAVIGFSDMMQTGVDIKKVPEYAGIINSCGLNLLEIIEDIFNITLLESGEVTISKDEFKANHFMDDINTIIELEKEKMGKQNIAIQFISPEDLDYILLKTDRSKLKQIMLNVIKNALKFTFKGSVEYGFNVEVINERRVVKFFVRDTGIGIRKEHIDIIFDNFRQVDDSNTRLFGGTGLGLSVAKRYLEMIGGNIWVESTFGIGSTFYFTIPNFELLPVEMASKTDQPVTPKFKGKTILIAEDEVSNYELLIVFLENLEVNTLWAHDGAEAISICEANSNIDLVLMDIKMPKVNGIDATSRIRKTRPNLPIIAQTAFVLHGDDEKALEAGCNDYIGKPIKRKDLYRLIAKYLKD